MARFAVARLCSATVVAVVLSLCTSVAQAQWSYSKKRDAMRNTSATVAKLQSTNTHLSGVALQRQARLTLVAWDDPSNEDPDLRKTIGVHIGSGLFNCPGNRCIVSAKVDDGPIELLSVDITDDFEMLWLYPNGVERITEAAATGKQLILEVPLYRVGDKQFVFRLAPLRWPK